MNIKNTSLCVGVIMDGNRRWAKSRHLPVFMGHAQGYQTLKSLIDWAKDVSVGTVVAYAFSEENWNRTKEEVEYILDLFRKVLTTELETLIEKKIKVSFIGNISRFPEDLRQLMRSVEEKTSEYTAFNLALAVSYGGREEIIHAVNTQREEGGLCTVDTLKKYLYTADLPDPDMIIRTSGEKRLSGFLLWQSSYSELFFTDTLWPDFSKEEFLGMIAQYHQRQRRFGV
jgi:undecaprenyl diphosphate synthase